MLRHEHGCTFRLLASADEIRSDPGFDCYPAHCDRPVSLAMRAGAADEPSAFAFSYHLCASATSGVIPPLAPNFSSTTGSYVSARAKAAAASPASAADWNIKRAAPIFPLAMYSSPLLTITLISAASSSRGGNGAIASVLLCDHSSSTPLRSITVSLARRSSMIRSMMPTKPRGGVIAARLRSLTGNRHPLGPTGAPTDTADPCARPVITTSMSESPSAPETITRAEASTCHRRAALIVSWRARSRALASSDCKKNDRSADTGAGDGWAAGAGTTRVAGNCGSSDSGRSRAAHAISTRSGTFGPGAELHRYASVPAAAAVATTIRPIA